MESRLKRTKATKSNAAKRGRALVLSVLLAASVGALFVVGQGQGGNNNAPAQGQQESQNRRREPRPTPPDPRERDISLTLTPMVFSDVTWRMVPTDSYRVGDQITIFLNMTNNGAELLSVTKTNPFFHNRPRLLKDGQLVPYSREALRAVRGSQEGGYYGSVIGREIEPGLTTVIDAIDLSRWYGQLEPGSYELTLRYVFQHRGRPIESNTVTFEIVP